MAPVVEVIPEPVLLGEGPHWDVKTQSLYFVDVFGHAIHKYTPSTNIHTRANIGEVVTIIIPTEGSPNKFVITIGRRIVAVTWDGVSETVSKMEDLAEVENEPGYTTNRFNDGKADPTGRLWAGTMGTESSALNFEQEKGSLYSLVKKSHMRKELSKITLSNGLAWNAALKKMYFIDSMLRTVDEYDYDSQEGTISNKKVIFNLEDHNIPGIPDGMTIDTEGNLWVAVYNGSCVIRIDPRSSKLLSKIDLPTQQITSVAFGGPNLDVLYVTSGRREENGVAPGEPGGSLFKVTGTGAKGLAADNVKL